MQDFSSGLWVISISIREPAACGWGVATLGYARGVAVSGDYAYVAGSFFLEVIDIANPASPQLVGGVAMPGEAWCIAIAGNYAYVAGGASGLQVIDITNPSNPQPVGGVGTPGRARGVAIAGTHAYVADYSSGLQVAPSQCADPQAVYLLDLQARREGSAGVLSWLISLPQAHAGFRVWREAAGLARTLLGEAALSGPHSYEFVDLAPPAGATDYWLEEVTTDGSVNWYGPAHMSAAVVPAALVLGRRMSRIRSIPTRRYGTESRTRGEWYWWCTTCGDATWRP